MKCTSCNASIPDNLRFCISCGHQFTELKGYDDTSNGSNSKPNTNAIQQQVRLGSNQIPVSSNPNNLNFNTGNNINQQSQTPLAGFWIRLLAYLIDFVLISIFFGAASMVLKDNLGAYLLLCILAPWMYEARMTSSSFRGTVGKYIVKIQVLDEHNCQLTFGAASVRYWIKALLMLVTLSLITLPCAFRNDKKTGYDILLRTSVTKR